MLYLLSYNNTIVEASCFDNLKCSNLVIIAIIFVTEYPDYMLIQKHQHKRNYKQPSNACLRAFHFSLYELWLKAHLCVATFVASLTIITSNHCVNDSNKKKVTSQKRLTIKDGQTKVRSCTKPHSHKISVVMLIVKKITPQFFFTVQALVITAE